LCYPFVYIFSVARIHCVYKRVARLDAKKLSFDIRKDKIPHIFEDRPGHLSDTPANRNLLLDLASDPKNYFAKPDIYGNIWCEKILADGTQVWAQVFNGQIKNGGLNLTPKLWNPKTGLSKNIK